MLDCGCPSIEECRNQKKCLNAALQELDIAEQEYDPDVDELKQFLNTIEDYRS